MKVLLADFSQHDQSFAQLRLAEHRELDGSVQDAVEAEQPESWNVLVVLVDDMIVCFRPKLPLTMSSLRSSTRCASASIVSAASTWVRPMIVNVL